MSPVRPARGERGFLLLEVMVSIIVITGGLLFVMRVYSTAHGALDRSRALFKNSILLEEAAFDFEEKGIIKEGIQTGRFAEAKDYSWRANAIPLSLDDIDLNDLNTVELGVFNNKTSPPEKYFLFTYLFKKKGL